MLNKMMMVCCLLGIFFLMATLKPSDGSRYHTWNHNKRTHHKKVYRVKNPAPVPAIPTPSLRESQRSTVDIPSRHEYTISRTGRVEFIHKDLETVKAYKAINPNGYNRTMTYVYFVKTAQE